MLFSMNSKLLFLTKERSCLPMHNNSASTYDYIVALREQEQQLASGQQSPQMFPASSITGLSSAISFNTFHQGAWCTPPRLFVEDQSDVVPPETGISAVGKRIVGEEPIKKKAPGTVKINPWTLARLNADEVSKVAAEARKKSKILQPVVRHETPVETDGSIGSSSRMASRPENRRQPSKRIKLLSELPMEPLPSKNVNHNKLIAEISTSLAPL